MHVVFDTLCERGHLPEELPPSFARGMNSKLLRKPKLQNCLPQDMTWNSLSGTHRLERLALPARLLSIVNPVSYVLFAAYLAESWQAISKILSRSRISISLPVISGRSRRSISAYDRRAEMENALSSFCKSDDVYMRIDIANAYGSVPLEPALLSHALASCTNEVKQTIIEIGSRISQGQADKVRGLPLGPDTSVIMFELIMSQVDEAIERECSWKEGLRYFDDYFFRCPSWHESRQILQTVSEVLDSFGMKINTKKTIALRRGEYGIASQSDWIEAAKCGFAPNWLSQIDELKEELHGKLSRKLIDHVFDVLAGIQNSAEMAYVVKTGLPRINWTQARVSRSDFHYFQSRLLELSSNEPQSMGPTLKILLAMRERGHSIDVEMAASFLQNRIASLARSNSSNEIAWCLWAAIVLEVPLDSRVSDTLNDCDDDIIALLVLEAQRKRLISSDIIESLFAAWIDEECFFGEHWLFSYEYLTKSRDGRGNKYLKIPEVFSAMQQLGITFCNFHRSHTKKSFW